MTEPDTIYEFDAHEALFFLEPKVGMTISAGQGLLYWLSWDETEAFAEWLVRTMKENAA
jgi:hypothetical protein